MGRGTSERARARAITELELRNALRSLNHVYELPADSKRVATDILRAVALARQNGLPDA